MHERAMIGKHFYVYLLSNVMCHTKLTSRTIYRLNAGQISARKCDFSYNRAYGDAQRYSGLHSCTRTGYRTGLGIGYVLCNYAKTRWVEVASKSDQWRTEAPVRAGTGEQPVRAEPVDTAPAYRNVGVAGLMNPGARCAGKPCSVL